MSKEIQNVVGEKEIVYSVESDNTWVIQSSEIDADTGSITISNPLLVKAIEKGDLLENWKVYVYAEATGYTGFKLANIKLGSSAFDWDLYDISGNKIALEYTLATGELEATFTTAE